MRPENAAWTVGSAAAASQAAAESMCIKFGAAPAAPQVPAVNTTRLELAAQIPLDATGVGAGVGAVVGCGVGARVGAGVGTGVGAGVGAGTGADVMDTVLVGSQQTLGRAGCVDSVAAE